MSIPLDNLYHWIDGLLPEPVVLYVFQPAGSKKISDCNRLHDYDYHFYRYPSAICNDQELLDWKLYDDPTQYGDWVKNEFNHRSIDSLKLQYCSRLNLKTKIFLESGTIYDNVILIHSEKNSWDLKQYQNHGFICVHYWAHAVIARDWYRFAKHDTRLKFNSTPQNTFLIYCRDWSNGREYRLKFLEMLAQQGLDLVSQTSVMHVNSEGVHFSNHQFKNKDFELNSPELIEQISHNEFSSSSSADYNYVDFVNTAVSVVLETVFDDSRIHLTEKTLRPIACGHPFILVGGPGSLQYVRSYGFKTFAPWIDESYDLETNSLQRMKKITQSMKQLQELLGSEREKVFRELAKIAEFNKNHFFSKEFFDQVTDELKTNLSAACRQVKQTQGKHYLGYLKLLKQHQVIQHFPDRQDKTQLVRQLRQSCRDVQSRTQEDPLV